MNRGPSFYSGSPETSPLFSPLLALATGAQVYTWAHTLPFVPKGYGAVLVNVVAEIGYQPGDEADVMAAFQTGGLTNFGLVADASNLTALQRATIILANKGTAVAGAFTEANWRLKFYIWP